MSRDDFKGKENDAIALRQMAKDALQREEESFQRSDTDGCYSQFALSLSARMYEAQAKIAEGGGKARFLGLYDADRRVPARLIEQPMFNAPWRTVHTWLLRDDSDIAKYGRRYIPSGARSRIQKQLGLSEASETAPARAKIGAPDNAKGMGGMVLCYVDTYRTGCKWGTDAVKTDKDSIE